MIRVAIEVSSSEEGEGRRGKQTRNVTEDAGSGDRVLRVRPGTSRETETGLGRDASLGKDSNQEPAGVAPGPLTPAEKQRAYRERLKSDPERYAAYLERERRRKHGG